MTLQPLFFRLIALLLLLAAPASALFGDAVASTGTSGMERMGEMAMSGDEMAGMDMAGTNGDAGAMPCCAGDAQKPAMTCDKSACPSMAACMQQCIPASTAADGQGIARSGRESLGLPSIGGRLASLGSEPPARPPRA